MFHYYTEKEYEDYISKNPNDVLVLIDARINGKKEIIKHYANAIGSPFLEDNWEGYLDTICDLGWLPGRFVSVFHKQLPTMTETEMEIYIGFLCHADSYWSSYTIDENYPKWASLGLKVFFDVSIKQDVERIQKKVEKEYSIR